MSVNKVTIIGRLGKDPEFRTAGESPVCNFSVATDEGYKDKTGQKVDRTEWHRVVVWGKLAEICNQYLKKGRQVYLEGKLQTRSYEKDGVTRYTTEIVANTIEFLGSTSTNAQPANVSQAYTADGESFQPDIDPNFSGDDIPF